MCYSSYLINIILSYLVNLIYSVHLVFYLSMYYNHHIFKQCIHLAFESMPYKYMCIYCGLTPRAALLAASMIITAFSQLNTFTNLLSAEFDIKIWVLMGHGCKDAISYLKDYWNPESSRGSTRPQFQMSSIISSPAFIMILFKKKLTYFVLKGGVIFMQSIFLYIN